MINQFLSRFNPEEASSKTITFSYLTTPQIFQMSVEVRRAATQGLLAKSSQLMPLIVGDLAMCHGVAAVLPSTPSLHRLCFIWSWCCHMLLTAAACDGGSSTPLPCAGLC